MLIINQRTPKRMDGQMDTLWVNTTVCNFETNLTMDFDFSNCKNFVGLWSALYFYLFQGGWACGCAQAEMFEDPLPAYGPYYVIARPATVRRC